MQYFQVRFDLPKSDEEVLIAFLADAGFDMFEEHENGILAYLPGEGKSEAEVISLVQTIPAQFTGEGWSVTRMEDRNWNETWEKSFDPVVIADRVVVRAPFHPAPAASRIDLVIEPKMSFGTGHHPTTALMIESMLDIDWRGSSVLDMGCGSGVLAILAARLGAGSVLAVDIDDWSVMNTLENIGRNGTADIEVLKGNSGMLQGRSFDVVLANINRNILLHDLPAYAEVLRNKGRLHISGFLAQDVAVLTEKAASLGLHAVGSLRADNWMMLSFVK